MSHLCTRGHGICLSVVKMGAWGTYKGMGRKVKHNAVQVLPNLRQEGGRYTASVCLTPCVWSAVAIKGAAHARYKGGLRKASVVRQACR